MPFDPSETRSQGSVHMDAVRGLAAILVMLGHSRDLFFSSFGATPNAVNATTAGTTMGGAITFGNEAVMIFFILSGYLVGGSVLRSVQRRRWSWKDYLTKRLTRLWVVLVPAIFLTVALDYAGLRLFPDAGSIYQGPAGQVAVAAHLAQRLTPATIAGNVLFLQGDPVSYVGTNVALWSLANEFWYYLLFPLLVLAWWKRSSAWLSTACLALAAMVFFLGSEMAALFTIWLMGVAISLIPMRLSDGLSLRLSAVLGGLLLPVMILIRRLPMRLIVAEMCIALYFGVLLYVLLNRTKVARQGWYARSATMLANLSYPLYLVHLPILVFLCAVVDRPWHYWTKTPVNLGAMLGMDCVALAVAYLFHLLFQRHTEAIRLFLLGRVQHQRHVPTTASRAIR